MVQKLERIEKVDRVAGDSELRPADDLIDKSDLISGISLTDLICRGLATQRDLLRTLWCTPNVQARAQYRASRAFE